MNLIANSAVVDSGADELGRLVGVTVNLATNQVAELLVSVPGGRPKLVPVHLVSRIDGEVQLTISDRAFRGLPPTPIEPEQVAGSRATGLEFARVALSFGAEIACLDGPVGTLGRVLCDAYTFDIEELVIAPSRWLDHEVGVPIDWVEKLEPGKILLGSTREEIVTQPYAPEDR